MNSFLGVIIVISAVIWNCVSEIFDQTTGSIPFRTVKFPTETTIPHRITRDTKNTSCIPSVSKVNGETGLCKYSIIFSDFFSGESLDKTKWDFERRFGGDPDYEFVLYSDQNAQIIDNKLEIKLSENKDLRQFYEVSNCTGKESTECVYYPTKVRDIMAPIMSSRISTKKSFSFQYGRIEIRAKLPKGDWVVPLLILEPKEFKYDSKDYRNGQIRIAFLENNPTTQRRIKQGPLLGAKEPFRTSYMSKLISNLKSKPHFHKYVVEWKPDGITTFMDDKAGEVRDWRKDASSIPGSEAWSETKTAVAPFDQEFFISLGVSVGGINDFQSGTPWDLRSPTQHREFNDTNWRTILNPDDSTLVVDYVKVFAVS